MKVAKTNAIRILESAGIPFSVYEYSSDGKAVDGVTVAQMVGKPVNTVFKTLVTVAPNHEIFVFCIPVACELNLKKAAKAAGVKSIAMLPLAQITAKTGYVRGGCSPVGMKKLFPIFIDETALLQEHIVVSAGKIGMQIEVAPEKLAHIVQAVFADCIHTV